MSFDFKKIKNAGLFAKGEAVFEFCSSLLKRGYSSFPDGLFVDGVRVPTGPGRRVFITTHDRKMRPIRLSPTEEAALQIDTMELLPTTAVWRDKIKLAMDEEAERGRIAMGIPADVRSRIMWSRFGSEVGQASGDPPSAHSSAP